MKKLAYIMQEIGYYVSSVLTTFWHIFGSLITVAIFVVLLLIFLQMFAVVTKNYKLTKLIEKQIEMDQQLIVENSKAIAKINETREMALNNHEILKKQQLLLFENQTSLEKIMKRIRVQLDNRKHIAAK